MGSQWENLKCGISRKWLIIEQNRRKFGTYGVLQSTYVGYLWWLIDWVWFGVIRCTLQYFQFYSFLKALFLSQFSSNSSNLTQGIMMTQAVTFWRSAKNCKHFGTLKVFLAQDHMHAAGIFKVLFALQINFHWSPSKLYDNFAYHGKSKCLLEYSMRSWHPVPEIHILFKTFQNILVYWVFSSSRTSSPLGLFFLAVINMGPYGSEYFKTLTPPTVKSLPNVSKLVFCFVSIS